MEKQKFDDFYESIEKAFTRVAGEMAGICFEGCDSYENVGSEKISVIIGMVGKNKGRILFEVNSSAAKMIAEGVNGESVEDGMETYLFLSEFTNTFIGNAVTAINNKYRGTSLRLTPPAVFAGLDMEITTPNIQSTSVCFKCGGGMALLDIGFEGRWGCHDC